MTKLSLAEKYAVEALQDRIWTSKTVFYSFVAGFCTASLITLITLLVVL